VDTSRERDQSVEKLLRRSLVERGSPSGATDACLDAETLAAWVDGGLSGPALEMAQTHVAECHRCQSIVGTMGRVAGIAAQPSEQSQPDRRPRWWLGWVVPLTAAAAVVTVWVAVSRDQGSGIRDQGSGIRDQGSGIGDRGSEIGVAAPQRADEPVRQPADERAAQPTAPAAKQEQAAAPQTTEDRAKGDQQARVSESTRESVQLETAAPRQETVTLNSTTAPQRAADAAAAPSEGTTQEARRAAAPPAAAPPAAAPPTAAPPAAAPAAAAPSVVGTARIARLGAATVAGEIASPDPQVRWRIRGTVLERSIDGASTWQGVATGVTAELTAGSAPSSTVCWVVGRGGTVLLSADGRTWRRVAFPEPTDLSAIQAADARTATVTTADGRTFVTSDAGATWARR